MALQAFSSKPLKLHKKQLVTDSCVPRFSAHDFLGCVPSARRCCIQKFCEALAVSTCRSKRYASICRMPKALQSRVNVDQVDAEISELSDEENRAHGMPFIIIPIHGTWARKAKWIQSESPLLSRLSNALGGASVEPFPWSGKNSHKARRQAAEALRSRIGKLAMDNAGSQIVVIGHSHGGTVALYALEDNKTLVNVAGLICLSTPFISVNSAPLSGSLPSFFPILLASTFAIVYALLLHPRNLVTIFTSSLVTRDIAQYLNIACGFTLTYILIRQWLLAGERAAEDLDVTPDPSVPLLIMRCSGDEASAALATSQFFTWLIRRFWQTCTSLANLMGAYFEKNGPQESLRAFMTVLGVLAISTVAGIGLMGGPAQISAKYNVQFSWASILIVIVPLLCSTTYLIGGYANACFVFAELLFKVT